MPSLRTGRPARAAIAGAVVLATIGLTGCGSDGVMHRGSTALEYDGKSASASDLQTAAQQITKAIGSGTITASDVAGVLALEPQLTKLGKANGVVVSDDQVKATYPKVDFTPTALNAMRASTLGSELQNSGALTAATAQELLKDAKVTINPRYGTWVPGKGASAAPQPWISPKPSQQAPVPNGRPAE
ncbi:hypothetical protein HJ588_00115 [Flexivirga sp. ID2601S]|uniref:Lipoprotein n=1 Tax=Flexivirga aerilata TaxID=1656889 RepID=A0A849AEP8_9MICO|nr:hypothetical protein [Flexivirga aerilata]NNG37681.1 hypothetical protein [Flexivirga aerilata]